MIITKFDILPFIEYNRFRVCKSLFKITYSFEIINNCSHCLMDYRLDPNRLNHHLRLLYYNP